MKIVVLLLASSFSLLGQIAGPTGLTARYFGGGTGTNRYYWVQSVLPTGRTSISGPLLVVTGSTLDKEHYVNLYWNNQVGALFYDVLRTTTSSTPTGTDYFAIGQNVGTSFFTDSGQRLQNYTVIAAASLGGGGSGSIAINGQTCTIGSSCTVADATKASSTAATTVNGQTCTLGSTCTVVDSTKVATSTTVNGHALSSNVTVTAGDLGVGSSFASVTDASPIAWNVGTVLIANGTVTLVHTTSTRALNVSNMVNGGTYTLIAKQDSTGSALMTLGSGCTWKGDTLTLSTAANKIDILTWMYDGTNCYLNLKLGF